MSWLIRLYPAAWRARHGRKLEGLIADMSEGGASSWRLHADVARGPGLRARASAASGGTPEQRSRAGALVVLWAWPLVRGRGRRYAEDL